MALPLGRREIRQVGARVRQERERLGLSRRALARRMQMRHTTLRQVELGVGDPKLTTLLRIARVLGVPLSTLVASCAPRRHVGAGESRHAATRLVRVRLLLLRRWLAQEQGALRGAG